MVSANHESPVTALQKPRTEDWDGVIEKQPVNMMPYSDDSAESLLRMFPKDTMARMLRGRLHNAALVTMLLFSPLWRVVNMPAVVISPLMRTAALLACILDVTGFFTAVAFRLRLWHLRSSGLDEQFATDLCGTWHGKMLATISPMLLIANSIVLFLITLSGTLFTKIPNPFYAPPPGAVELIILGLALLSALVHFALVFRTIVTIGKS